MAQAGYGFVHAPQLERIAPDTRPVKEIISLAWALDSAVVEQLHEERL
jgi:hypothetical protein